MRKIVSYTECPEFKELNYLLTEYSNRRPLMLFDLQEFKAICLGLDRDIVSTDGCCSMPKPGHLNQDRAFVLPLPGGYVSVVCDGVTGSDYGGFAANYVSSLLLDLFKSYSCLQHIFLSCA